MALVEIELRSSTHFIIRNNYIALNGSKPEIIWPDYHSQFNSCWVSPIWIFSGSSGMIVEKK